MKQIAEAWGWSLPEILDLTLEQVETLLAPKSDWVGIAALVKGMKR